MERSKVLFRSAVGGYNKQDVNNYIAKLSQDFEAERRGLQGQLSELSAQLEAQKKLGSESNNMSERLAWLEDKLAQAEALVAAQSEQLDARGAELEELRTKLSEREQALALAHERIGLLSETEDKLREYDRMSSKVGEIMLEAASSAERIKAEAKLAADETLRSCAERERQLKERESELERSLNERYTAAVAAINKKLSELSSAGMDSLTSSLNAAQSEIEAVLERQRAAARAMILQTAEKLPELEALSPERDK